MVGQTLAASGIGGSIGYAVGMLVLPLVGVILLFLGIWKYRARQSAPPGWYPPPYPPPAARPTGGPVAMIVVGSVLLVFGLAGAGLAALESTDESVPSVFSDGLQVGQCITDTQYASADMSPEATDCGAREAVYELAYQGEGPAATCPDGRREDSGYAVLFNNSRTYCFVLNVAEGECFSVDPEAQLFTPVDCTDSTATSKIDRIIEGADDLSQCPAGPQGAAFPEPARTYCVVPAQ
jgi:hypothetical protein